MSSGDLISSDDRQEHTSNEVQFALVIARMIESIKDSPEDMRQVVYDLARYKLQEQLTHADAKGIANARQTLETAIRGVEKFSKQQVSIPAPRRIPELSAASPPYLLVPDKAPAVRPKPPPELNPRPVTVNPPRHPLWAPVTRTLGMLGILVALLVAFQQRERLASLVRNLPKYDRQAPPPQLVENPVPKPRPEVKPNPLLPADYGVYAINNDSLAELQLLPGRPPDIRVAVSGALKIPSPTILPNGHPKFIVFRRDAATNIPDRAEVRMMAKITREFSAEAAGKKLDDSDVTWVIRNVSFPFRSSPVPDSPEMYELHSEDPALELSPGRYALVLKTQGYEFTVPGDPVDPRQCIERIVATNGTFYSDCKKP